MTAESSKATVATPNRVLIILLGAIGDVVRALPLLGRMRRAWPQAHIAWAVEPKSSPIIEAHPWLDELIIYDRRHAPWSFLPFLADRPPRPLRFGDRSPAPSKERDHRDGLARARSNWLCCCEHQGVQSSLYDAADRSAAEPAAEAHAIPDFCGRARSYRRRRSSSACRCRTTKTFVPARSSRKPAARS